MGLKSFSLFDSVVGGFREDILFACLFQGTVGYILAIDCEGFRPIIVLHCFLSSINEGDFFDGGKNGFVRFVILFRHWEKKCRFAIFKLTLY